jgi:serine/threonine protein kinase
LQVNNLFKGRSLGQGTFGKVRLGTHVLTGEKVAIKILEKDKIKD